MSWLIIPLILFLLNLPTQGDLLDFLETDKTNEIPYVEGEFVCHHFAETLYYNSKEECIPVGFVSVKLEDTYHALNVFPTNEGLVFIDCSMGYDAIVKLEIGKPYTYTYSHNEFALGGVGGVVLEYRIIWDINDWATMWKE